MFSSQRKGSRTTLRATAGRTSTAKLRVESTGLGASVRAKEAEVGEFTEELPAAQGGYAEGDLVRDVNYLNSLYSHILLMVSAHLTPNKPPANNQQLVRMSREIQRLIGENVSLKESIDTHYRSMVDLHTLAEYMGTPPAGLTAAHLQAFFAQFEEKEKEAERLSSQLRQADRASPSRVGTAKIQEKEKRCTALRRAIEKEKAKISKLEAEEKALLRRLYDTQRQIVKNEHSSSAIKLKLHEAEGRTRRRSATNHHHRGKENDPNPNRNTSARRPDPQNRPDSSRPQLHACRS